MCLRTVKYVYLPRGASPSRSPAAIAAFRGSVTSPIAICTSSGGSAVKLVNDNL